MVSHRGLGPPFWFPGGRLELLLGSIRVPCDPKCPPGRFIDDFGAYFGSHLESKIDQIWCRFLTCFRDAFLSGFSNGFGYVLGDFLVPKR